MTIDQLRKAVSNAHPPAINDEIIYVNIDPLGTFFFRGYIIEERNSWKNMIFINTFNQNDKSCIHLIMIAYFSNFQVISGCDQSLGCMKFLENTLKVLSYSMDETWRGPPVVQRLLNVLNRRTIKTAWGHAGQRLL